MLVGLEHGDDAGIFRLSDDLALVQTVDFFTPIVDDPFLFGQIAAANALSDVYAMGGTPLCAMNLVAFPSGKMDIEVLRQVLRGGLDKVHEAGAALVGGHSISDPEMKYGLAVTGKVHPDRVMTNRGGRAGDRLVLTKPLGTGILNTALKRGKASEQAVALVTASMAELNGRAAKIILEAEPSACTDVTGFGLAGHAAEMIEGSGVGLTLYASELPLFPQALDLAVQGCVPGGLKRNRDYRQGLMDVDAGVPAPLTDLLYDPQTSGGLLAAVPASRAEDLVCRLRDGGVEHAAIIGEVTEQPAGRIRVIS